VTDSRVFTVYLQLRSPLKFLESVVLVVVDSGGLKG
jgi:hypothetical protein